MATLACCSRVRCVGEQWLGVQLQGVGNAGDVAMCYIASVQDWGSGHVGPSTATVAASTLPPLG